MKSPRREELETKANRMMSTLLERHDVLAKGWHEPVYGKKIHIGNDCPTCGTHFAGLREDIKHLFEYYAEEYATAIAAQTQKDTITRVLELARMFAAIGRDDITWGAGGLPGEVLDFFPAFRSSTADIPRGKREFMDFVIDQLAKELENL